MGSRRKLPLRYFVEFTGTAGAVREMRGVIEVRVRHHTRARECARLKLARMGCHATHLYRATWIEPLGTVVPLPARRVPRFSFPVAKTAANPLRRLPLG